MQGVDASLPASEAPVPVELELLPLLAPVELLDELELAPPVSEVG